MMQHEALSVLPRQRPEAIDDETGQQSINREHRVRTTHYAFSGLVPMSVRIFLRRKVLTPAFRTDRAFDDPITHSEAGISGRFRSAAVPSVDPGTWLPLGSPSALPPRLLFIRVA